MSPSVLSSVVVRRRSCGVSSRALFSLGDSCCSFAAPIDLVEGDAWPSADEGSAAGGVQGRPTDALEKISAVCVCSAFCDWVILTSTLSKRIVLHQMSTFHDDVLKLNVPNVDKSIFNRLTTLHLTVGMLGLY